MNIRSFKIFFLLFMCLLTSSLMVSAAGKSWEFAGWHGGGCFPNIAFDPVNQSRVYMASDVAGVYRSDDLGENWYFVTKGLGSLLVSQVAIAPSDFKVLYAATKDGIFVSKDAAASWQAADTAGKTITFQRPNNYKPIAIDAKDPAVLCIGTAKGALLCSGDFGTTWKELDPEKKVLTAKKPIAAVAFDNKGRVYAAGEEGVLRCLRDTLQCELLGAPKGITDLVLAQKSLTIYAAGQQGLWFSKDDGATWVSTIPVPKGKTYRVAVDESVTVPIIRVAWLDNWKGGVVSSTNGGLKWEQGNGVMNGDPVASPSRIWADKNTRLTGLFIYPFNPQVLFRTDGWGVWRSHDGGKTWYERIIGAPNVVGTQIVFAPNGDLYATSMDNGLLRSRDQGKTYEMLFPSKYDDARAGHVWRVALAGDTIVGTSSPWNDRVNQVILSTDGGKTFDLIRDGIPSARPKKNTMWGEGYPRALAVDPKNPDIIYLGIDGDDGGGLFISRDRGRTWQRSVGQPGALRIYNGLAVDPTNTQRIIWGANAKNGGIYISENGGQTFEHVFKQIQWIFDVHIAPDGTMYAAGDNNGPKLFVSIDHGRTWKLTGDFGGPGRALGTVTVDASNPRRIAISTADWGNGAPCAVHLSEDGGKSWVDITGDLPDGAGAASMAFDPQGKYLYITRYAGSVYRLEI